MSIYTSPIITESFLKKYKKRQPNWGLNGLGYVVYKRTYSRIKPNGSKEEWYETIARCINGVQEIGAEYTKEEAERLYDLIFNLKCSFAGRMLWQLGTKNVKRFGANSLLNCWGIKLDSIDSFCFLFENLMLGGGVGFSIRREDVHELPRVKKDVVITHKNTKDADFIVPDSREGWVYLLRKVLKSFFYSGKSFTYSTILVRGYGEPIKGFGGTASGPKILINGIENICKILRAREGKKLRSLDALDIANNIASIVVSGNIRRCLPYDSLVHCKDGLKEIDKIKVDDKVLTTEGYRKVKNIFYQGEQEVYKITTENSEFEATGNHRVAVMISINEYIWKTVRDLKKGDNLILTRKSIEGKKTYLPSWEYIKPKKSTTCKNIIIPELDEDIAWLIGTIHANGYVYANKEKNGFNARLTIAFNKKDIKLALKAIRILRRFNVNPILKERKKENTIVVRVMSKQLAWYFYNNIKKPKTPIIIPSFIKEAKENIKLSYLYGIAECDGALNNKPIRIVGTIYNSFALDIQRLLFSCGIETKLGGGKSRKNKKWKPIWHVSLMSIDSQRKFLDKNKLLKSFKVNKFSRLSNSYSKELIKNSGIKIKIQEKLSLDRYIKKISDRVAYIPSKVIKIEKSRKVKTYDIEVKDKNEFFCNGYLVHNSATMALGDPDDYLFIRAKRWNKGNIPNWRAMSNNTIYADDYDHIIPEVWEGYKGNGEPYGLFNVELSQKYGRLGEKIKDNCELLNPCVTGDTYINTVERGFIKIEDLYKLQESGFDGFLEVKRIKVHCLDRANQKSTASIVRVFKTRKNAKIIKIRTRGGVIKCTYDHLINTINRGWVKAIELKNNDILYGLSGRSNVVCARDILGVEKVENEDVYDMSLFSQHNFFATSELKGKNDIKFSGICIHNCGEVNIESAECCNLSDTFLPNVNSKEELWDCIRLLYKTQKTVAAMPFIHEVTNKVVHRNMRLGIGITGICQSLNKLEWLDNIYKKIRKFDKEWSKKRGWNESIKLTTIKPSGCGVKDTEIRTEKGIMTYEEIFRYFGYDIYKYKNRVWLPTKNKILKVYNKENKLEKISKLYFNGKEEVYKFTTEDGKTHYFTKDHSFLVRNKGWIKVKDLKEGDDIIEYREM